jgi:hypothetical protein
MTLIGPKLRAKWVKLYKVGSLIFAYGWLCDHQSPREQLREYNLFMIGGVHPVTKAIGFEFQEFCSVR